MIDASCRGGEVVREWEASRYDRDPTRRPAPRLLNLAGWRGSHRLDRSAQITWGEEASISVGAGFTGRKEGDHGPSQQSGRDVVRDEGPLMLSPGGRRCGDSRAEQVRLSRRGLSLLEIHSTK